MNAVEEYGRIDTIVTESSEDVRKIIEGDNKLNIIHLNIRSLRKNFDELIIYLDELKIENVDIIILSETWQIAIYMVMIYTIMNPISIKMTGS